MPKISQKMSLEVKCQVLQESGIQRESPALPPRGAGSAGERESPASGTVRSHLLSVALVSSQADNQNA